MHRVGIESDHPSRRRPKRAKELAYHRLPPGGPAAPAAIWCQRRHRPDAMACAFIMRLSALPAAHRARRPQGARARPPLHAGRRPRALVRGRRLSDAPAERTRNRAAEGGRARQWAHRHDRRHRQMRGAVAARGDHAAATQLTPVSTAAGGRPPIVGRSPRTARGPHQAACAPSRCDGRPRRPCGTKGNCLRQKCCLQTTTEVSGRLAKNDIDCMRPPQLIE
jgi:hypothetical protein